jgi:hypothetical protein
MPQTIEQVLKDARLYSDDQAYRLIKLPPNAITAAAGVLAEVGEPFGALLADKDEVTLIMPADALEEFAFRLPGYAASEVTYRLVTFDVELEPTLVGFLAQVSAVLAKAGIPILAFSAYSRDHLLVTEADFAAARATLDAITH